MLRFYLVFLLFPFYVQAGSPSVDFQSIRRIIFSGDLPLLKEKVGSSVHIQNSSQQTLLHLAVIYEQIKIVRWLLKNKVQVNIRSRTGKTPLHLAALKGNPAIAQLLIQNGARIKVEDQHKNTPLHYSSQRNILKPVDEGKLFKTAQLLVQKKPDFKNVLSETALHLASYSGYLKIVSLLLKHQASVLIQNIYGQTPLHQAVLGAIQFKNVKAYEKIFQQLLNHNTPVNRQDQEGRTALHYSAENGLLGLTKIILDKKPQVNLQTKEGWSALHLASANAHFPIMKLLIEHGANVNLKDKENVTPLYFAVGSGNKQAVALLLKSKAIVFLKDQAGGFLFDQKTRDKLKNLLKNFHKN